jgi:hypothetical protein
MKIVLLIITNSPKDYTPFTNIQNINGVYYKLHKQWIRYMNSNPNIQCFFITLTPNITSEFLIDGNTLWIKGTESYVPGIYEKTIKALKICLELSDAQYFIRTNLSSFWIFDRLISFLTNASKENYISSGHVCELENIHGPHGSNFIMSRDVAEKFSSDFDISEKSKFPDDIVFGLLCKKYDLIIQKYEWCVSTHIENPEVYPEFIKNINPLVFTIRNNLLNPEMRFKYEAKKYEILIDTFYQ